MNLKSFTDFLTIFDAAEFVAIRTDLVRTRYSHSITERVNQSSQTRVLIGSLGRPMVSGHIRVCSLSPASLAVGLLSITLISLFLQVSPS